MLGILVVVNCVVASLAWTAPTSSRATGSIASSFGGSVLLPTHPSQCRTVDEGNGKVFLTMKKGKPNVPPQMRGQYKRAQELSQMREQMIAASKPGNDGLPVFNLFVRSKKAKMWYPCGSFKGDERSGALAKSYADGGLLAGISKKQLDTGISGSLYRDQDKLAESVIRGYPQLKASRAEGFEWGYRLAYEGLPAEKANDITLIEPKEQKGVFDNIKSIFS